ncbi:MAG: GNAT family N-acetyltransferase, partial [Clostridia bacterium]
IETVAQCLADAQSDPRFIPVGLYDGSCPIGFAMYGAFPHETEHTRVWLDRFFIDKAYQGHGYGERFLTLLLSFLQEGYGCARIYLSLYADNVRAKALYEKHGFHLNGEVDPKGELLMVKILS